jgi:arylsulfatase A-like enzyme
VEIARRRGRIVAASIALVVLWVTTAVWIVPWVIAKAYAGEAGAFLNARITGQAQVPVEAYLATWRGIALRATIASAIGVVLLLVFLRYRSRVAAASRCTLPGLPARGAAGVLILAVWAGCLAGVAEALVSGFRTLALDLPTGGVPWPRPMWMAPLAATVTFVAIALVLIVLDRLVRADGAITGSAPALFIGLTVYSLLRRMSLGIDPLAVGLLAAGCGIAFARALATRPTGVRRTLRWSLPVLASVIGLAAVAQPIRAAIDQRALAELPAADAALPSVLVVVWDAVRAPNLSLYGAGRETSPELASFASRGVVFDRAMTTAPWSLPAHASLFTGRYPFELSTGWTEPLDDTHPTLAEVLSDAGFATAAFVGNLYFGRRGFGLERGFAHYDDLSPTTIPVIARTWWLSWTVARFVRRQLNDRREMERRPASDVNRSFLRWQARNKGRPFFAFLNYIDAHVPYRPPDPFHFSFNRSPAQYWYSSTGYYAYPRPILRQLEDAYDGAIRYIDYEFGRLLGELDRRGVSQNLIVIVTSDHGEEFGEHDVGLIGHGRSLYIQALHVPLVIAAPGLAGDERVARTVSIRDVPATILDLLDLVGEFPGESLATITNAPHGEPTEPRLAQTQQKEEYKPFPQWPAGAGDMSSLVWDDLHYIVDARGGELLFDIGRDPQETNDLASTADAAERLQWFREQLKRITGQPRRP